MSTLLTTSIWITGIILEGLLLIRGLKAGLLPKFPIFYWYVFSVFAGESLRFVTYQWQFGSYPTIYWITQFIALVFGSALMFEVYSVGLKSFPGAARMTRNFLFLVFALLLAKSIANASPGGFLVWFRQTPVDIERDLRVVQAFCLIVLVGLFRLYKIPVDRNLRGIVFGYGVFVASGVVTLSLVSYFWSSIQAAWSYATALSYVVVLVIWLCALWSRASTSEDENKTGARPDVETDYDTVTSATRRRFKRAFSGLIRGVRT